MDNIGTQSSNEPLTYNLDLGSVRQQLEQSGQSQNNNVGDTERLISSLAGGAMAVLGLSRRNPLGFLLAAVGGAMIHRGVTGQCNMYKALGINTAQEGEQRTQTSVHQGIHVEKSITINKPVEEVYAFWRNFENLPRFMKHLESVTTLGAKRSHWVAKAPVGSTVEWDAEIINEKTNELIAWRSLQGSDVDNVGSVRFEPSGDNLGTDVRVNLRYNPPAGKVGALVAKLFHEEPNQQIESDLKRLKQVLETGAITTDDE